MAAATIKKVNAALAKAGIPLEIERAPEGYHYFIYDDEAAGIYETESEYIAYTSHQTVEQWVEIARGKLEVMRARCGDCGKEI